MRTLKFTDPSQNYVGVGYLKLKVDSLSTSTDNCTIYEKISDTPEVCEQVGLSLPVPFVTSMGDLKKLAISLGLRLEDEEILTPLVEESELADTVAFADVTGKAGEVIDLVESLTVSPVGEAVEDLVIENLKFTILPVDGEVLASVSGTNLTLLAVGETTVQFETVGKYGQSITGVFDLEVTTPYPDTVTFTEATLTGVADETIDLLGEIAWTPLNIPTAEYVEETAVFSSSDPLVAEVEDGILTLVAAGTATITVTVAVADGSPAITDTISLTVTGGE